MANNDAGLIPSAKCKIRQIDRLLSEPNRKLRFDPELRFVMSRIRRLVDCVLRITECRKDPASRELEVCFAGALDFDPGELSLDAALATMASLEERLLTVGDERYICEEVISEYHRRPTTDIGWKEMYGGEKLKAMCDFELGRVVDEAALSSARNCLSALHRARSEDYGRVRARSRRKRRLLWILAASLLLLVVAWGLLMSNQPVIATFEVALVAVAGGIGATMSGVFKLRDELERTNELRQFEVGIVVQALLGAAGALLMLLVLVGGPVTIGRGNAAEQWAMHATIGFVAGFSEPFLLGIVRRIAAEAEKPDPRAMDSKTERR